AQAMSVKDAVGLAVTSNPEVGVVSNDRRAIDQELRQGRALYYPQVDVRGATGVEFSDNVTTADAEEDGDRTLWRKEASLTISQLLFDGFFAESEVERQASRVRSAAFRVYESAEFVGLDAIEAYLEVQRHRERVQIAEENVGVHQGRLAQVQQRADAGGGNIADVRQAEARLANAESALIQTQGNLRDAEAFFIRVVGQAPDTLEPAVFPSEYMPADVDAAVNAAIEHSPTVAFARQDVKTSEFEVKQQEASLYPDFRLELGASIGDDVDGRTVTEYDAQAMVVMRYNLYRGGADTARIREFKWRQAEAIDRLRQFEREAGENARVSWNAVEVSRGNVEILGREVQANINTVEVYKQQFEIGQRGLLDLLDADNELYLSRDSLITAGYAETFANFRLLATQGALQKSLGVTPPDAATIYQD
ncbi:MAG: TolC family outer membrane protein, partial [Dongiaceae bacterium]